MTWCFFFLVVIRKEDVLCRQHRPNHCMENYSKRQKAAAAMLLLVYRKGNRMNCVKCFIHLYMPYNHIYFRFVKYWCWCRMFCLGRKSVRVTSVVSPSTCCSSIQTGGACLSMLKIVSWGWWIWECKYDKTEYHFNYQKLHSCIKPKHIITDALFSWRLLSPKMTDWTKWF